MAPQSSLSQLANGSYELDLHGFFPHPHWMVFLFSGLADSKVSVISGRAIQDSPTKWEATFHLDFKNSAATPEGVDYVTLAQTKPARPNLGLPKLTNFRMNRQLNQSLEVHLDGPDQLGFLGGFLTQVSLLALFPVEIEVNTVSSRIQDRLVFRGFGGMAPGAHIDGSLKTLLDSFMQPR